MPVAVQFVVEMTRSICSDRVREREGEGQLKPGLINWLPKQLTAIGNCVVVVCYFCFANRKY